jgi:hypothetical protein
MPITQPSAWNQKGSLSRDNNSAVLSHRDYQFGSVNDHGRNPTRTVLTLRAKASLSG